MAARSVRGLQLFVSRLHWTVSKDTMIAYFEKFGTVRRAQIVFDMKTGFSKGFGFVTMSSPEEVENVLEANRHMINGLEVSVVQAKIPPHARQQTVPLPPVAD